MFSIITQNDWESLMRFYIECLNHEERYSYSFREGDENYTMLSAQPSSGDNVKESNGGNAPAAQKPQPDEITAKIDDASSFARVLEKAGGEEGSTLYLGYPLIYIESESTYVPYYFAGVDASAATTATTAIAAAKKEAGGANAGALAPEGGAPAANDIRRAFIKTTTRLADNAKFLSIKGFDCSIIESWAGARKELSLRELLALSAPQSLDDGDIESRDKGQAVQEGFRVLYSPALFATDDPTYYNKLRSELAYFGSKKLSDLSETSPALDMFLNGSLQAQSAANGEEADYNYICNVLKIDDAQKNAIRHALSETLTVVTGPPGTGKTQTIVNLIANCVMRGQSALIVSKNNHAVDNVVKEFSELPFQYKGVLRLGNKEQKAAGIAVCEKEWRELSARLENFKDKGANSKDAADNAYLFKDGKNASPKDVMGGARPFKDGKSASSGGAPENADLFKDGKEISLKIEEARIRAKELEQASARLSDVVCRAKALDDAIKTKAAEFAKAIGVNDDALPAGAFVFDDAQKRALDGAMPALVGINDECASLAYKYERSFFWRIIRLLGKERHTRRVASDFASRRLDLEAAFAQARNSIENLGGGMLSSSPVLNSVNFETVDGALSSIGRAHHALLLMRELSAKGAEAASLGAELSRCAQKDGIARSIAECNENMGCFEDEKLASDAKALSALWARRAEQHRAAEKEAVDRYFKAEFEMAERRLSTPEFLKHMGDFKSTAGVFPVVACSNLSIKGSIPANFQFDMAILDEASQSDAASIIPILMRAKRACIIGDDNQLRHVSKMTRSDEETIIAGSVGKSAALSGGGANLPQTQHSGPANQRGQSWRLDDFSYGAVSAFEKAAKAVGSGRTLLLNNHYRCRREIIQFCNENFYQNKLSILTPKRTGAGASIERALAGRYGQCMVLKDIDGKTKYKLGSAYNEREVKAVINELVGLIKMCDEAGIANPGKLIGVVTPFRSQKELISSFISSVADGMPTDIEAAYDKKQKSAADNLRMVRVGTVHTFQGIQRDIILMSAVAAEGAYRSTIGWFDEYSNLVNVAVSRARSQVVLIGSTEHLARSKIMGKLVDYIGRVGQES